MTQLICTTCGKAAGPLDWRCPHDGGLLRIADMPPFDPTHIDSAAWDMWRYAAALPMARRVSLGEGGTPLIATEINGRRFFAKLEYMNPTGSYKDRGTSALVNHLLAHDVREVVEDSSGNAGASLAAYAAAAGIRARVFVPGSAPAGKKQLIAAFGAEVVEIPGPRAAATEAVQEVVKTTVYATHAYSPLFIAGQQTVAWEIWEQLGRRAPDAVLCPAGHGGLFAGLVRGFRALQTAGLIDHLPRLYAVQSAACDPLVRAWERGLAVPEPVEQGPTAADGIVVTQPVHGAEVLAAVRETGGAVLRVDDPAILAAQAALHRRGLMVEPTSAVAPAALAQVDADGLIAIPLTGSGLKTLH